MSLWPPPPTSLHPHCSCHPQCCSAQLSPAPPHSTLGSQAIFLWGSLVPAGNIFPHPSTFCSKHSFTQCCPQPWSSIHIRWPLRGPGQSRGRRMRKFANQEGADGLAWLPAPAWKAFLEPESWHRGLSQWRMFQGWLESEAHVRPLCTSQGYWGVKWHHG